MFQAQYAYKYERGMAQPFKWLWRSLLWEDQEFRASLQKTLSKFEPRQSDARAHALNHCTIVLYLCGCVSLWVFPSSEYIHSFSSPFQKWRGFWFSVCSASPTIHTSDLSMSVLELNTVLCCKLINSEYARINPSFDLNTPFSYCSQRLDRGEFLGDLSGSWTGIEWVLLLHSAVGMYKSLWSIKIPDYVNNSQVKILSSWT